jgi:hypothetical protein
VAKPPAGTVAVRSPADNPDGVLPRMDRFYSRERHKWIESDKAGYDIGFEHDLFDWTLKYRSTWLQKSLQRMAEHESPRTSKLYDGTKEEIASSEAERIRL